MAKPVTCIIKKDEVGSIYKFGKYWKIQYRDTNGSWKSRYISRQIVIPEGKVNRPMKDVYQLAEQVGLSTSVIYKSIAKIRDRGQT